MSLRKITGGTILLLVCVTLTSAACPSGWPASNGNCYKLVYHEGAVNACTCSLREVCLGLGADLVSIENQAEESFIFNILNTVADQATRPRKVLLGITDLTTENTFENLDGTPLSYTNWKGGEPDNDASYGEDCVAMETSTGHYDTSSVKWIDIPCCFNDHRIELTLCKSVDGVPFVPPTTDILHEECFGNCPDGWWAQGGQCFSVFQKFSRFEKLNKVREVCRQHGGDLPVLDTQEALDVAMAMMRISNNTAKPTKMFLGMTDLKTNGIFTWVNGNPYVSGTPLAVADNGGHCVTMTSSDDQWRPGSSTITWQTEGCCDDAGSMYQALCTRPVDGDYDMGVADLMIRDCYDKFCPRGAFIHNGVCYNYLRDGKTFQEARDICEAEDGSNLLPITSGTYDVIHWYLTSNKAQDVWTGLHDVGSGWQWTDGSTYLFEKFAIGEPDGLPNNDCVQLLPNEDMMWGDTDCNNELGFVCIRNLMYSKFGDSRRCVIL